MKLKHLLAVVVLPLALVAAACSDDDGDSGAGAADRSTEESADSGDGGSAEEGSTTTAAPAEDVAGRLLGSPPAGDTAELNIGQIAAGTAATQTLTRLVLQAGLLPAFLGEGPLTVFAPTDDAFAAVPERTVADLVADTPALQGVLTLHVVPGALTADDLRASAGTSLTTLNGGALLVEVDGDDITVGGAKVVVEDITASNGVVHAIDTVITAPNG